MPAFVVEFTRLIERTYTLGCKAETFAEAKEFYQHELKNLSDELLSKLSHTDQFSEISTDFDDAIRLMGDGNTVVETKRLSDIHD